MKQIEKDTIEDLLDSAEIKEESASKELLTVDLKNLPAKSELSEDQVVGFSKLSCFAKWFDIPEASLFEEKFLQFQISKKRAGRKEFLDSLKSNLTEQQKRGNPFAGIFK